MKKGWLIILALVAFTSMLIGGNPSRYEVVHYQETFESGATGWTHYDGGESPNNWHIYANGDAQANVWWMGDPALASGANIGGYYDHQYLVLDTPARTIASGASNLTFKMRHNVEEPGASGGYDGWDSINLRVSTDGGAMWTVLTGTPAYHYQNSYSFGFEHGEGMGIPGWGGATTGWVNATFDLSAYVNQSIKIRFAFASDPAQSTGDAAEMYGVMIDDIAFGGYTNNGVNDGQMTWSSLVPLGGDIWAVGTDPIAPSPTHVMKNQNATGSYNVNMMNYLVSPAIELPTSGDIRCDFMIKGGFVDPDVFPEVDYFGWEISVNNGITWFAMSNPYGEATGSNFVYSDAPAEWASMTDSYSLDGLISDYAGETAKFRWYFKSDADTPSGVGIAIDDFKIYNDIFIAEPEDLEATVDGANITLNWIAPGSGGGGEEGWMGYDDGTNADAIGTNGVVDFDVAAKWDPVGTNGISAYVGMNITKIKFWPNEAACAYAARIWTGAAGTLLVDQPVTTPTIGAWNEIVLSTPWTIPSGTIVMAGYRCNATLGYPAGCDDGPQVEGYGNVMRFNNAWTTLSALNATFTYNWNIQVYVQDAAGREYLVGTDLPQNVQYAEGTLQTSGVTRDRDVNQYKIYRDTVLIDQIPGTVLTYTDMNVSGGLHSYYVTAMYGTNESLASNTVTAFVLPLSHAEISNDDGTAESGFSVGSTKQMAAKYNYNGAVTVKYAKVYVHTLGTAGIIIRVFDNDGAEGMPGTQLAQLQYPAAQVVQGWNYITLPEGITVADGDFYVAILETTGASLIGMDTSDNGNSYKKLSATWEPVTEGDVMIRAIVQFSNANDDGTIPAVSFTASNYPNPFNPETTIAFGVKTAGMTSLKVYNMKGQVVRTLVNAQMAAGNHSVVWNGTDDNGKAVSSGIYFYKYSNAGKTLTHKMVLTK